jgi:hypothetical protein
MASSCSALCSQGLQSRVKMTAMASFQGLCCHARCAAVGGRHVACSMWVAPIWLETLCCYCKLLSAVNASLLSAVNASPQANGHGGRVASGYPITAERYSNIR